jgi:membrane-bound lytic murein transglycosylase B
LSRLSAGAVLALGLSLSLASGPAKAQAPNPEFAAWLTAFKDEALRKGISPATIAAAFESVEPIERVLELDRRQPEFTLSFWRYFKGAVAPQRVEQGRQLLARHGKLLREVRRRYGVQPRFLVAFWGLESNYGEFTGGFSVIGALATLAHDTRRSAFFRGQLFDALKILDEGHITPAAMTGSWAGAMGQLQFIPSTFNAHALDYDGDGRQDIWNSLPDIFGSAANYLNAVGWRDDQTWGREVRLPADFNWDLAGLTTSKPIQDWQAIGVRRADGRNLPKANFSASIILPAGHKGPAFMVYQNFRTMLTWNRSILYALAVGHLSDRIAGKGPLLASPPQTDERLSFAEVEEMQRLLAALGFDPGSADGIIGSRTRRALKKFQLGKGAPADGYPTPEMLRLLRHAAAQ